MRSEPAPTPPPLPPVHMDSRLVEPDEQWKADLRKRIEFDLRNMVEDAQNVRDMVLSSQPSESSRERAQREYEDSMNAIRNLAQEEFNPELRVEMSQRKWALDVVDSNSPDVARQQRWILVNIRKTDDDRSPSTNPDAPQNSEGVLFPSPQVRGDSKRASDESLEGGYGSARSDDEGSGSGQSMESEEDEEEEDEEGEGYVQPQQSRPPSRPNLSLTQPLHSRSPVSRRDNQSQHRWPSNFQSAEDRDEDAGGSPAPAHPAQPREGQPFLPAGSPPYKSSGSHDPVWSLLSRPLVPSGISRASAHANGQMYSPGLNSSGTGLPRAEAPVRSRVTFPSVPSGISTASAQAKGQMYSVGSNSSGTGLHRTGSLTSDQHRSRSVTPHNPHNSTERPPTQAHDRIASNIGPRGRQMSASASPHDGPSPLTSPAVVPRAIPGARPPPLDDAVRFPTSGSPSSRTLFSMQRSPEDLRQGIAIPRGPTTPEEGPRGASWGSLHSRRHYGDFSLYRRHNSKGDPRLPPVDGDISDASDDVLGQLDDRQSVRSVRSMELEQVASYWEAESRRKEEEAIRKEEEASKKEEEARRLEEKARLSLEEAERLQAGARQSEASAKMREAAAQKKEAEAKHKEAEAQKREAEAQKRVVEVRRKEEAARQREHEARRKEEQARWKEEEAQRKEEEARKREDEVRQKWDDAHKREDDARKREEDARERERLARQKEEDARRSEEEARKKEEEVRRKVDEARRKKEEARRIEQDYERKRREIEQREAELIRKDQELAARLAQEEFEARYPADETSRLESEATSPVDAAQADASNRTPEDSARQAQDAESSAPAKEGQQEEIARQRAKEEQQKEFLRREAQYYQRMLERERQNSMGASFEAWDEHRSGSTTTGFPDDRSSASSTLGSSAGSTWSNRASSMNSSHTSNIPFSLPSSVPLSSTPRPSPRSARPGTPGTSPFVLKMNEAEWARRAEERARQQQEQFRREQERIESERQARSAKVLSQEELIRLYENNENKWRLLKEVLLKETGVRYTEEEVTRKEGGTRRREEGVRHLEERIQQPFETAHWQRFQSGVREVEVKAKKSEAEVQRVEEQLREKERLLKIREVEVQKALQEVNERTDVLRDREENLYRREAALMQSMAIERQRNGAYQDSELDSLATESTIRNTSKLTNVALSPKSYARMKEDSDYFSNEG